MMSTLTDAGADTECPQHHRSHWYARCFEVDGIHYCPPTSGYRFGLYTIKPDAGGEAAHSAADDLDEPPTFYPIM